MSSDAQLTLHPNTPAEKRRAMVTCADFLGYECRPVLEALGLVEPKETPGAEPVDGGTLDP